MPRFLLPSQQALREDLRLPDTCAGGTHTPRLFTSPSAAGGANGVRVGRPGAQRKGSLGVTGGSRGIWGQKGPGAAIGLAEAVLGILKEFSFFR